MFALLLILVTSPARSNTTDDGQTTAITIDAKTNRYIPLKSGTSVAFDTPGPRKLLIQSRRRLAGAGQRSKAEPIEVRGDGNPILTIKVPGSAIADGRIHDRLEGFPSNDDKSLVTVPEGGKQLTLTAPPGGPDFFIRVSDRDQPGVLLLPTGMATETPATVVATPTKEAPRSGDPTKPSQASTASKNKQNSAAIQNEIQAGAGLEIGFGVAARGTSMVFHIGATGRYPIYKDLLSVGGSLGWHRIGVETNRTTNNPIAGTVSYAADWHTDIIPIIGRVSVHVPYPPGPVTPIASVGLGTFIASRTDGERSTTSVAIGPELAVGCEFGLPVGLMQSTISWSEARAQMGNQGVNGQAVSETFAVTRLNLAYLYVF